MRRRLMFLSHRLPWPPDKGEKIRAWHVLAHLARDFDVHLGCVADDPADTGRLDQLRQLCVDVAVFPLNRRVQTLRALLRGRPGRPLMPDFYHSPALQRWVDASLAAHRFDTLFVYTVAMAPYAASARGPAQILDAVDIDSEKWASYATRSAWPARLVWAREARTLLAYERHAAAAADATLFVSPAEAARFIALAPEAAGRVDFVENGVDLARFSPDHSFASPFGDHAGPALVFTGHMDYWPNADAVAWFARHILPALQQTVPALSFWIVGANPGTEVQLLARLRGVHVTGRVADTRPYTAHAAACVCPLRIARGIQNKVLEAMAMARPVIASMAAFEGIRAQPGRELLVANQPADWHAAIHAILSGAHPTLGQAARTAMEATYAWSTTLTRLDRFTTP